MNLSKNFTLKELCATSTGVKNVPTQDVIDHLTHLVENVLQPIRDLYGKPITVNSGYRCEALNKCVGGARTSQHMTGQAVDITTGTKEGNRKLFAILEGMEFDQLIDERDMSWIHVSFKSSPNRNQKLKL